LGSRDGDNGTERLIKIDRMIVIGRVDRYRADDPPRAVDRHRAVETAATTAQSPPSRTAAYAIVREGEPGRSPESQFPESIQFSTKH